MIIRGTAAAAAATTVLTIAMLSTAAISRCRAFVVGGPSPSPSSSLFFRRCRRSAIPRRAPAATRLLLSSSPSPSDQSAASKSRAPFRMPRDSPDDSRVAAAGRGGTGAGTADDDGGGGLEWNPLGLLTELVDCLEGDLALESPTRVQSLVIPELLKGDGESLAFLSATGSGKTLAYLLPLLQQLKQQEMFGDGYERRLRRPRLLVLVPTRELALQITRVLKSLSHSIKMSSQALVGGQDRGTQRKALASRPVDVVVATPGRLLQHWKDESVFLGSVQSIVLDEMDTMLEQGFQRELKEILYPLLYARKQQQQADGGDRNKPSSGPLVPKEGGGPQIVLTSATMTQSIQKLLGDNPKTSKLSVGAKKLHGGGGSHPDSKLQLPPMKILSAPGLHRAIPRLEQIFVDVGNTDKSSLLVDVLSSQRSRATMVFCNTASSVQFCQYALAESRLDSLSYHGELNSIARSENLRRFRAAASSSSSSSEEEEERPPSILVCTDLAARGIDVPQVDHVVMFDFPLNAVDYLHRSGRTARGEGRGRVTALVTRRDRVLATAIEQAVRRGDPLDGLSSRKSDYAPGGRFGARKKKTDAKAKSGGGPRQKRNRGKGPTSRGRRR